MDQVILCVDDERIILESLRSQLKRRCGDDYIYETAASADEAWEIIEELDEENIKIIIIVSDWLMPGIKGDEFLIRVHKKYPDIIKLMLTGQADSDSIENAKKNANILACIHKPWNEEELIGTIKNALKGLEISSFDGHHYRIN